MLNVTDDATKVLLVMLESNEVEENHCLRLIMKDDGQFGFEVTPAGSATADEQSIKHEDREVLIVAEDVGEQLDGLTLDAQRTPEGQIALTLSRPEM